MSDYASEEFHMHNFIWQNIAIYKSWHECKTNNVVFKHVMVSVAFLPNLDISGVANNPGSIGGIQQFFVHLNFIAC